MTNKAISDKLGVAFPKEAIKRRQGGGGRSFDYVEGHSVINRLNAATDNTWDLAVREITTLQLGTRTVLQARVALTIPGLGTREHLGVQEVNDRGGEDLIKGVVTDALKKAATLFGVGLELYGPDFEDGTPPPQSAQRQQRAQAAPAPTAVRPAAQPAHGSTSQWDVTATKINEGQRRYLEGVASERLYTHDDMKRMITERYPVTSSKDLTGEMFEDFKKFLNGLPRQSPSPEAQANLDDFNRRNPAQPGRK
jgi:hypothetical protein